MDASWQIHLFGGLRVRHAETISEHTRFRTQKAALLLAFLSLHPRRHSREELAERLFAMQEMEATEGRKTDKMPGPMAARNQLKTELYALRKQLEPNGQSAFSLLMVDRLWIGLNSAVFITDVGVFEAASREADTATADLALQARLRAIDIYRAGGPLLPGYYDDWIVHERDRLEILYLNALHEVALAYERSAEMLRALHYALSAVHAAPETDLYRETAARLQETIGRANRQRHRSDETARPHRRSLTKPQNQAPDLYLSADGTALLLTTLQEQYRLLAPKPQRFCLNMAVFTGGCTAEAAAKVCRSPQTASHLEELQTRLLVTREETPTEVRYRMPEPLRLWAWQQLSPQRRRALSERHARFMCILARDTITRLHDADTDLLPPQLANERANLLAALNWTL